MRSVYLYMLILCLCGCSSDFKTEAAFYKWWHNASNGLVKHKYINDFKLSVKYMPAAYLAYNELKGRNFSQLEYDSLYNKYRLSRTFLLSISPAKEEDRKNDVLFYDLKSVADYKKRVIQLNFSPGDYIHLKTEKGTFKPVLSTLENVYNVDAKRSLYLVFADEEDEGLMEANEIDFVFEDNIFDTGINHFVFSKNNLDDIPEFGFLKI